MASKIKDALPSHLKPAANGSEGGDRHHGKSQSHVVSHFPVSSTKRECKGRVWQTRRKQQQQQQQQDTTTSLAEENTA